MGPVLRPAVHPVALLDSKGSIKVIGGGQYGVYPGDARGMCIIGHDVGKVFIPVFCGPYDTIGMVRSFRSYPFSLAISVIQETPPRSAIFSVTLSVPFTWMPFTSMVS